MPAFAASVHPSAHKLGQVDNIQPPGQPDRPPLDVRSGPKASQFWDPVVLVIGRMVGWRPGVFVHQDEALPLVLREVGLDPDALPDGWVMNTYKGVRRRIQWAVRNQSDLPRQPARHGTAMCLQAGDYSWALTEAGVGRARALDGAATAAPPVAASSGAVVLSQWRGAGDDEDLLVELVELEAGALDLEIEASWGAIAAPIVVAPVVPVPVIVVPVMPTRLVRGRVLPKTPEVEVAPRDKNESALHLEARLAGGRTSPLYRAVVSALANKLRVSAATGMVHDHAQEFFAKLIHRNSLRGRLANGQGIPDSLIASWAVRSGRNDARGMGTNPVCRELYGARTDRERRVGVTPLAVPSSGEATAVRAVFRRDDHGRATVADLAESRDVEQSVLDGMEFEAMWGQLEQVMARKKPQAWRRYAGIVRKRAEGWSLQEIADGEGVSHHRAASMLAESRLVLREAALDGDLDELTPVYDMRISVDVAG